MSDEGGGREEGADTELKTKTPHVNVGKNNPNTTHDASLTRKAKARIVLLGFQHPDLELSTFNTTAPVQSQLKRHLSLITVAQRG